MTQRVLVDGLGWEIRPNTTEELLNGLRELDERARAQRHPRVAQLYADPDNPETARLSIGLGAEECVLVFTPGGLDGEGAYSKGAHAGDDTEVWFAYGSSDSEYEAWMLVPKATAFAAMTEFFHTGQRPGNIEWEPV